MPLQKQTANINFAQGLDTKTDPWQVQPGKMLELQNAVFEKQGQLKKRNGFKRLASLPDNNCKTVTTFKGGLVAFGKNLYSLTSNDTNWVNYNEVNSVKLAVNPIVRRATSQLIQNTVVNNNGLACTVWEDADGKVYYQLYNASTGQIIITSQAITGANPNVVLTSDGFIIFYAQGTSLYGMKMLFEPPYVVTTPAAVVTALASQSSAYSVISSPIFANSFIIAYTAASTVKFLQINDIFEVQIPEQSLAITDSKFIALSSFVNDATTISYVGIAVVRNTGDPEKMVFNLLDGINLNALISNFEMISFTAIKNAIIQVFEDHAEVFYTKVDAFWYENNAAVDSYQPVIQHDTISWDGSFTASVSSIQTKPTAAIASQAFVYGGVTYFLACYDFYNNLDVSISQQPTYFLLNEQFQVIGKLAAGNGAFNVNQKSLSFPTVIGNNVYIGYLLKTLLTDYNNNPIAGNVQEGFYSQVGINLSFWDFSQVSMDTAEIGTNLHINGGLVQAFDGANLTEQNFNVFPEQCVAKENYFTWTVSQQNPLHVTVATTWIDLEVGDKIAFDSTGNVPNGLTAYNPATGTPVYYVKEIISALPGAYTFSVSSTVGGAAIVVTNTGSGTQHVWEVAKITQKTISNGVPTTTNNVYWYQAIYEYTDAQGNIHRSSPSPSFPAGGLTLLKDKSAVEIFVPKIYLTDKVGNNQIRIIIYRYSIQEPVFHQVSSTTVPLLNEANDTAERWINLSDYKSDAEIIGNPVIYTTGNVLPNVAPPPSAAISLFKNRLWVVDAEDKNLLWFSKPVLEQVPVEFALTQTLYISPSLVVNDSSSPITALAAMDDKLVIFKRESIYYLTGIGPDITGANNDFNDPVFITSTIGCINTKSIVLTPNGLMFESDKGRWLLGRDLSTQYIGAPVERYNDSVTLSSITVPGTNQVRFTLDNGLTLMYDYFYGQWGTFTGIANIGSTVYQSLHTFIDRFGNVYQESPGVYWDGTTPVEMKFQTAWFNMAGLQGLERIYFAYLIANYISPHKLLVGIAYDYNPSVAQTVTIKPTNYSAPFGDDVLYGTQSPYGGQFSLEQWRIFFNRQKCQSFQMTVQEQFDPTLGTAPGAGLTMSGINLTIGVKLGRPKLPASQSTS